MAKFQAVVPSVRASSLSLRNYSSDEVEQLCSCEITLAGTKDDLVNKMPGTVYDLRMGPSDQSEVCLCCKRDYNSCTGHYGYIRLALPIYNPVMFDKLIFLLKSTCFSCCRLSVANFDKLLFCINAKLMRKGYYARLSEMEAYVSEVKKNEQCLSTVEVADALKEKYRDIINVGSGDGSENDEGDCSSCQNEVTVAIETLRRFDDLLRSSKKRCVHCGQNKPTLTHDNAFDILDSSEFKAGSSSTKRRTVLNTSLTTLLDDFIDLNDLEDDTEKGEGEVVVSENDDVKGTPPVPHQRSFIPLNIKYVLENLWKNERFLLKTYYGSNLKGNLCDMFLLRKIIVTPARFRPVLTVFASSECINKQSSILNGLLKTNNTLRSMFDAYRSSSSSSEKGAIGGEEETGRPPVSVDLRRSLYTIWKSLQLAVCQLYDSKFATKRVTSNPYPGFRAIIEAKDGIIRKNIMGKRVDYAGRSVISPDPFIATHEIGIPMQLAKHLDFAQPVNDINVNQMKRLVNNGPNKYPGARFVRFEDGRLVRLKVNDAKQRALIAHQLSTSSSPPHQGRRKIVYRHLLDGDYLMINRQPTLHRPSFMGHAARVLKNEKVLRLHYSNCKSYNADFDGDELNVHFPQDEMARTEVAELMFSTRNYLAPKDGSPLGGLIHDHIIASVKLSVRGCFLKRDQYVHLINQAFTGTSYYDKLLTFPPAIQKPTELWTGKQVISTIILNLQSPDKPGINIQSSAKISGKHWSYQDSVDREKDPFLSEDMVIFRNGELMVGVIDKNQIGSAPRGLIHCAQELCGGYFANAILSALSRLLTSYLQFYAGFSLGAEDVLLVSPTDRLKSVIYNRSKAGRYALRTFCGVRTRDLEILTSLVRQAHQNIDDSGMVELDAAYKSVTDKLQSQMTGALFSKKMKTCSRTDSCLPLKSFPTNDLHLMILAGAKGSAVNALQMSCMLGQQELEGRRPPLMASGASIPCFEPYDISPDSGGFIYNSFATGLRPHEYFFHCMAGREGLVDTAVKTSRSGYLQRCLVKHLEGLCVQYDMTVRNADGSIIQFNYGEDSVFIENSTFLKPATFNLFTDNCGIISARLFLGSKTYSGSKLGAVSERMYENIREFSGGSDEVRDLLLYRAMKATVHPGEPVGLIAAQSIGEPSTQMTLNTFHFAGRGEMNVTLGIPRLREILMTTTKNLKTPLMEIPVRCGALARAERLRRKFERVVFKEVLMSVSVSERCERTGTRGISQVYGIRFDFVKKLDWCSDIIRTFENRFLKAFLAGVNSSIRNQKDSSLFKTVIAKSTSSKTATADNGEEEEEDGANERFVSDSAERKDEGSKVDEDEDVAAAEEDDGDGGRLKRRQDDEYDSGDEVDDDIMVEEEEENTSASVIIEEPECDDAESSSCFSSSSMLPPQPKRPCQSARCDPERIEMVMGMGSGVSGPRAHIIDYRYSTDPDDPWCELKLAINSSYGHVSVACIVDRIAANLSVRSLDTVRKCGIVEMGENNEHWMQIEGTELEELFVHSDTFDINRFHSNNIHQMCQTYGIEACQRAIVKECKKVFSAYGINVDFRHLSLVADYLTFSGRYTAFNRHAMASNASPLQKMSFEIATSVIKDCVLRGFKDDIQSPSARLFVGVPSRIGTGMIDLMLKPNRK